MVYEVPKSKASLKQNRFEFKIDGQTFNIPKLQFLSPKFALAFKSENEVTIMLKIFETYMPEALDKFEDAEQLKSLFEAWQEASTITAGESSASASS